MNDQKTAEDLYGAITQFAHDMVSIYGYSFSDLIDIINAVYDWLDQQGETDIRQVLFHRDDSPITPYDMRKIRNYFDEIS